MFENPRSGRLGRNFAKNVQKILDLKSTSEEIFSENFRWVPLISRGFVLVLLVQYGFVPCLIFSALPQEVRVRQCKHTRLVASLKRGKYVGLERFAHKL